MRVVVSLLGRAAWSELCVRVLLAWPSSCVVLGSCLGSWNRVLRAWVAGDLIDLVDRRQLRVASLCVWALQKWDPVVALWGSRDHVSVAVLESHYVTAVVSCPVPAPSCSLE